MRRRAAARFGGPEVLDVVDLPDPVAGDGEQLYEVSSAGINHAETHHQLSQDSPRPRLTSAFAAMCEGSAPAMPVR